MYSLALARFGISIETFLDLTPRELFDAVVSKEQYDGMTVKATVRAICDTLRTQTWYLYNIQLPKNKRVHNEKKLMRFVWDFEGKKPQTREEMKQIMKAIVAHHKNRKKNANRKRRSR